jgi:hypothetical protein
MWDMRRTLFSGKSHECGIRYFNVCNADSAFWSSMLYATILEYATTRNGIHYLFYHFKPRRIHGILILSKCTFRSCSAYSSSVRGARALTIGNGIVTSAED